MPEVNINLTAILIVVLVSMIIGALWYSPLLFAKPWMKLIGKTEKEISENGNIIYLIAALNYLIMAFVLAHIIDYANADTLIEGIQTGFWCWIGFVWTSSLTNGLFSARPKKLILIDSMQFLVVLLVMGSILSVF